MLPRTWPILTAGFHFTSDATTSTQLIALGMAKNAGKAELGIK